MKKLLVHIGLSKTATTSLQSNVFMLLHRKNKINYLGKDNSSNFFPFSKVMKTLEEKKLSNEELHHVKQDFDLLLKDGVLNVISNEVMSESRHLNLKVFWINFNRLISSYDFNLVVTLRNPRGFIFSYYVESYKWQYRYDRTKSSFSNFLSSIRENKDSEEYITCFFYKLFEMLPKPKVHTLLYEDLKFDKQNYSNAMSKLLGISSDLFNELFFLKQLNQRKKTTEGKYSEAITISNYIQYKKNVIRTKIPIVILLTKIPFYKKVNNFFIKYFDKVLVENEVLHKLPEDYDDFLSEYIYNEYYIEFIKSLNFESERLEKYGYL